MESKTNNEDNKNAGDGEVSAFEKLNIGLKNSVFGVLFLLLKDREISIYTSVIIGVIQFLQTLIFPFDKTFDAVWNSPDLVDTTQKALNYLNIVPNIEETSWDIYIIFFYICVVFVVLELIGVAFVSIATSTKKISLNSPVVILKYLSHAFSTILFLPFLDYFVSMLACVTDKRDVLVHASFTQIDCWGQRHTPHAITAIFMIIIFLIACSIISLTFFEYKNVSHDSTARTNSRPNFFLLVYKTVMIFSLTFLTESKYQILNLALILMGSCMLFYLFYFSSPYHNEIVSQVYSTLAAINVWTIFMLICAKIMETAQFEGSIIAWLLGIPFVVMIILAKKDPRIDLLLIDVNKFQSGKQVQDQVRYLLKLMDWEPKSRSSAILLDGYVEIHKQTCNRDNCPLKQKTAKNNRFSQRLMNQNEALNERYVLLIELLYQMFSYGIKKFPNNTALRIAYAFFLFEKMKSRQQALQELSQAELNKPLFDEQFIIFRYKRIIEDEMAESQNEGQCGLDVLSEKAYQNHLRLLQANIEKSALLHMEFWSQLSESHPDLGRLNATGSKVNTSILYVEDQWNKLLKINPNNAKTLRLYAKFLIEILNDQETGDVLLEKARNLTNMQKAIKINQILGSDKDDDSNDGAPTVWVSGESNKFGVITGINLSAASLFGFNKTELLNRKVNALMPQIFAKHHDSFLEHYLSTGEGNFVGKNRDRTVFGKHKSNYIFPVYLGLRVVHSIVQGIQFVGTFRIEKNFKNIAYVITQIDGTIDSITSSAINILKIDSKIVGQKKINLQDLIPNIIKDRHAIFSANGNASGKTVATISYQYPINSEYLLPNENPWAQLSCHFSEIVLLEGRENAGFIFKFERLVDKPVATLYDRRAKISNFQFRMDKIGNRFIGEYIEGTSTTTDVRSAAGSDDMFSSAVNTDYNNFENAKNQAKKAQQEGEIERIDYAAGIKTLRLIDGKPHEIVEDRGSEEDEERDGAGSSGDLSQRNSQNQQKNQDQEQEEDPQEDGSYQDFSTTFKSKKALTSIISDKTPLSSIKALKYASIFLGLVLLVIALVDYILATNQFDKINQQIDLLEKSNIRISELTNAVSRLRFLYLVNSGIMNGIFSNVTDLRVQMKASLDLAKAVKQELDQQVSLISPAHLRLLNDPVIQLLSIDGNTTYKGLSQATEDVMSRAYDVTTKNLSEIVPNNSDYFFVNYNLFNGLYQGLKDSSQYYAIEVTDRIQDQDVIFVLLLIGSIFALSLAVLILFPVLYQVKKTKDEILSLFLDIPDKIVKGLQSRCENFVANLQIGEEDEIDSEISDQELDRKNSMQMAEDFVPKKKKKKFKNSGRTHQAFLFQFLALAVAIECYFIYAYISTHMLLEEVSKLIPELNATSVAEPFYGFISNAQRQLVMDPTFQILNSDSEMIVTDAIKAAYELHTTIIESHSANRKIHLDSYNSLFNQIMIQNACPYVADVVACYAFADHTVFQINFELFQGMTVALSRHFENLRTLLSCYSKINTNQNCSLAPSSSIKVFSDPKLNRFINLLRTNQAQEMSLTKCRMQSTYIRVLFRLLVSTFRNSLKTSFDNSLNLRLIVFLIFLAFVVTTYSLIWRFFIKTLNNDIWKTKAMLNMIPLSVISQIKSIRISLKKFWNEKNVINS